MLLLKIYICKTWKKLCAHFTQVSADFAFITRGGLKRSKLVWEVLKGWGSVKEKNKSATEAHFYSKNLASFHNFLHDIQRSLGEREKWIKVTDFKAMHALTPKPLGSQHQTMEGLQQNSMGSMGCSLSPRGTMFDQIPELSTIQSPNQVSAISHPKSK